MDVLDGDIRTTRITQEVLLQKTGVSRFLPWWPPFLSWLVVLAWLSLTPSPPSVDAYFFSWDKLQHALAYGILTFLAGMAFDILPVKRTRRWVWAFIFTTLFGGLLEVAQGLLTEVRVAEIGDILANAAGSAVVLLLMRYRV